MKRTTPLLIVTRIETDPGSPDEVSAELLVGGRPEHVALDLSFPQLIGFGHTPDALQHHHAAHKAVIDLMMRRRHGEDVTLPADLSDVVRQANEPWPLRLPDAESLAADERATAPAPVSVRQVKHDDPEPGFTTIELDFEGTPTVVIVDRRRGPQRSVRFRFVHGAHPWQLTPVEQRALLVSLVGADQRHRDDDGDAD
jgi:hypothetical protein